MKVGVVGLGHVGRNVQRRLLDLEVEVVATDRALDEPYPDDAFSDCAFVQVCVGTPGLPDGSADVADVYEAVNRVACDYVLLRSTVPPGTTAALAKETGKNVCFSPEYVGESGFSQSRWGQWAGGQSFQVLGGPPDVTQWFAERLTVIYGPEPRLFQCSAVEAEIVKYMENCYFAVKVTFVNEFFELCRALGADWYTVREAWLLDPRIERDHTAVFPDARGYTGRCLPKDVDAILQSAAEAQLDLPLLAATREANAYYRDRAR